MTSRISVGYGVPIMSLRFELVSLVIWFWTACACGIASATIADRKHRSAAAFFLIGFVLTLVGLLIAWRARADAPTLPGQLLALKRKHAAGRLSDAEFSAARARLLHG